MSVGYKVVKTEHRHPATGQVIDTIWDVTDAAGRVVFSSRDEVSAEEKADILRRNCSVAACEKKDSNPKDTVGSKKVSISKIPPAVLIEVANALLSGGLKYSSYNWRAEGARATVYYDAVMRHLMAWLEGEDIDPDSGMSHVTQAISGLIVLRDSMLQGNWVDDRPPAGKIDMVQANATAKAMIEKAGDGAKPPYTQKKLFGI
jgi:hypothetical protein